MFKFSEGNKELRNSINILFVATSFNRDGVYSAEYDDMPSLEDMDGNPSVNYTQLEENHIEYFNLIKDLIPTRTIYYTTIDPQYTNDKKDNTINEYGYNGHHQALLSEILSINSDYNNHFDCVFITSAYPDMFKKDNIDIIDKILKISGILITTYPSGLVELSNNYNNIYRNTEYNIFIKK
jgi:hypothetical protein